MRTLFKTLTFTLLALGVPAVAQQFDRRAELVGGDPGRGRCMVAVIVDGVARIEMRRAEARLIDERGAPATWRHFECSTPIPGDPREFGLRPISGRGRVELIQPARDGAPAVIRIEDQQSGAGEYRFELVWRGGGGPPMDRPIDRPFDRDRDRDRPVDRGFDRPFGTEDAIRICQDGVRAQARDRFHTDRMEIRRIGMDEDRDRREWVVGVLEVRRDYDRVEPFRFSCSVDFGGRRIRSVDIVLMDRDRDRDRR